MSKNTNNNNDNTIHSDSDCIRLANRFLALLDLGVTNAVFI